MKIIFDSEEQKKFYIMAYCPSNVCSEAREDYGCGGGQTTCDICWQESGIELEVKEELTEMTTDEQYADSVYAMVKYECSDLDSIYEDYIIKLVGEWGLQALRENGLLEGCGYLNGRKLYVLCEK